MRTWIAMAGIGLLAGRLFAAATNSLFIDVGAPPPNVQLGFGWHVPERNGAFSFVWITHLEGDLWVTLDPAPTGPVDVEIRAAPYYLNYRSQGLGLFVNGRFVSEWLCRVHANWQLDSFTAQIPAGVLQPGKNRITLRTSYRIGKENNQFAVAVNSITLKWP